MKTKELRKRILIIISIILIINLILFVVLLVVNSKTSKEVFRERDTDYVRPELISLIDEDDFFEDYGGSVSKEYILTRISNLIYYISDNKEKIDNWNEQEIAKEYNENTNDLKSIGFENVEHFSKVINKVKSIGRGTADFSYAEFDIENEKRTENSTIYELTVKFASLDPLKIKTIISNTRNSEEKLLEFDVN